jgi:hypothetical protein
MHLAGPGADRDRDPALRDADPAADVRPVGSDGSPDHAAGAIIGCECSQCREARLADPDRIVYGAMDVASAYRDGWHDGYGRALRRILECS